MKQQDKVNFGLLGTGVIIRDYHLPCLLKNPRAELGALGNQRPESLKRLAEASGVGRTYMDFKEMARDKSLDAVVIGLPNYLHAAVTIEMLKAGKHVLCEKPMAVSVAEAESMVEAAEAADRVLMIAHMWRHDREVRWLRRVVDSGMLGTIFKI